MVLPAASFAEKDGTFTNTERKVQRVRKAVPAPGEARADWEIIADLAAGSAMGAELGVRRSRRHHGRDRRASRRRTAASAIERLDAEGGLCWPCPTSRPPRHAHPAHRRLHARQGQVLPDRLPAAGRRGRRRLPAALTTGRMLEHYHTGTMTRRSRRAQRARARPASSRSTRPTPQRLGVADGAAVHVRDAARRHHACPAWSPTASTPGTVFVPFHFWESPANRLTNPARDPDGQDPRVQGLRLPGQRLTGRARQRAGVMSFRGDVRARRPARRSPRRV